MHAKERWAKLESHRSAVLERARLCAQLTIPGLLPPEGWTESVPLPTPYQSLGARGVNNLSSKLLLSLLPPGTAFFRMQIDPKVAAELRSANSLEDVQARLAEYEQTVSRRVETLNYRPVLFEAIKHLVSAGNVLLHMPRDNMRMFRLDQYVISRNADGHPIEAVVKETVHPSALSDEIKAACKLGPDHEERVDVFTIIEWRAAEKRVYEWQEINGMVVPGSEGDFPIDKSVWLPLRWQAVPGADYGRGLCEEYLGDLMSLEGLTKAVVKFAAAAAKIVFLVKPASTTKWKDITNAESGDAVVGNRSDVEVLQLEKYADFQVAKSTIDELTLRLSHAFLLTSGTVRNAERVTAEEIRMMAQELEDVLGGVYTVLSQELQLPLVRRIVTNMTVARELPKLPESVAEPVIVTGFEALGRNHSVNKLRAWVADINAANPAAAAFLKWDAIAKRLAVGYGVDDFDQLIKSEQEVQQEQTQSAFAGAAMKAAPALAKVAAESSMAQ